MNTQQLSPFRDLMGQFGKLVLAGSSGQTVVSPVENKIAGGDFYGANLGPVTHHNKFSQEANLTQIRTQNVIHHHYYDSDRPDEPSTSGDQAKQEEAMKDVMMLTDSIKVFTNQKLHSTKLIYKGEKTTVGEPVPVAVKLMNYSKEALREAKSLHSTDFHPNVVRIYDSGFYSSNIQFIFIAMELCTKETLLSYINENQNFNPEQAINYSTQIISGLKYIHSKNILHRDLKPGNILFSLTNGYRQVKITDFGVSKNCLTDPHQTTNLLGTQGYMAPEIIKGEKPKDPTKCDIFSLGLVLAFILSNGKHPYGDRTWHWNSNIADGREPNLSQFLLPNASKRDEAINIVSSMLQHNPDSRPNAADALENWLNNVVVGLE